MPDRAWKAAERSIAKRLGGKRSGPRGVAVGDVIAPGIVAEVKERKQLPAWLTGAMQQAMKAARDGQGVCAPQLPIVILHVLGQRHDNDLVVMRLADFQALRQD